LKGGAKMELFAIVVGGIDKPIGKMSHGEAMRRTMAMAVRVRKRGLGYVDLYELTPNGGRHNFYSAFCTFYKPGERRCSHGRTR